MDTYIQPHASILVLNSSYEPINICHWKRAVVLLIKQKAQMISSKVIRLVSYVKLPFSRTMANLPTRPLIYKRDGYECQYCGRLTELTIDHVIPSSKGGKDTWENMVTACLKCNLKKGNKSLKESGMVLATQPKRPFNKISLTLTTSGVDEWTQYVIAT